MYVSPVSRLAGSTEPGLAPQAAQVNRARASSPAGRVTRVTANSPGMGHRQQQAGPGLPTHVLYIEYGALYSGIHSEAILYVGY